MKEEIIMEYKIIWKAIKETKKFLNKRKHLRK